MLMLLERQSKVAAAPVAEDRIGSERARQSPLGAAGVSPRSEFVPTARIPMNCLLSLACGFNAIGNPIWMEIDLSSADGPVPGTACYSSRPTSLQSRVSTVHGARHERDRFQDDAFVRARASSPPPCRLITLRSAPTYRCHHLVMLMSSPASLSS